MISPMATARPQQRYDHRLRELVQRTMGAGLENAERQNIMKCRVCGSTLHATTTDLPFKVGDQSWKSFSLLRSTDRSR